MSQMLVRHGVKPLRRRVRKAARAGQRLWLFDLDNTLHDASHAIFTLIDQGMTQAVSDVLGVDIETANQLRQRYWKRYGATMIGLHRHHGIDPAAFLARSHNFSLDGILRAPRTLAARLRRLPGPKVLLTNAPRDYACDVLRRLRALNAFDSIWSIENQRRPGGDFRPKPSASTMRQILHREGIRDARRAVLVDDTLVNLRGARQAGLRTIHVHHPGTPMQRRYAGRPGYVNLRVNSVAEVLSGRRPLRA